jgi:hypothetical protein
MLGGAKEHESKQSDLLILRPETYQARSLILSIHCSFPYSALAAL